MVVHHVKWNVWDACLVLTSLKCAGASTMSDFKLAVDENNKVINLQIDCSLMLGEWHLASGYLSHIGYFSHICHLSVHNKADMTCYIQVHGLMLLLQKVLGANSSSGVFDCLTHARSCLQGCVYDGH